MGTREEKVLQEHIVRHHLKATRQRKAILRAFLETERHATAEDLHRILRKTNSSIGLATIYRTLNLLCQCGLAEQREFGGGHTLFELTFNVNHHDHLVCTGCRKIIEFENLDIEKLQEQVARKNRFKIYNHKLELYGLCDQCERKKTNR